MFWESISTTFLTYFSPSFMSLCIIKHKHKLLLLLSSCYALKDFWKSKISVQETEQYIYWPEEAANNVNMSSETTCKHYEIKVEKILTKSLQKRALSLTNTFSGSRARIKLMYFYPAFNPKRSCVAIPTADQSFLFLQGKITLKTISSFCITIRQTK